MQVVCSRWRNTSWWQCCLCVGGRWTRAGSEDVGTWAQREQVMAMSSWGGQTTWQERVANDSTLNSQPALLQRLIKDKKQRFYQQMQQMTDNGNSEWEAMAVADWATVVATVAAATAAWRPRWRNSKRNFAQNCAQKKDVFAIPIGQYFFAAWFWTRL